MTASAHLAHGQTQMAPAAQRVDACVVLADHERFLACRARSHVVNARTSRKWSRGQHGRGGGVPCTLH